MKETVLAKFAEVFGGAEGARVFFAPGRVNLIGEHTDYNGGHVFPCALTIGTYGVVRRREDRKLRFYSMNFENLGVIESSLDDLKPYKEADWTNYPKGVMWAFEEKGMKIPAGMDILLNGNIPNGSGLSSSASVEVLTGAILRALFGFEVSNQDLALIGQFSENKFNGVNCGIMDQFAIAMGKKGHAIFLDTADLSYEYAPVALKNAKIVIACSNKKRGLPGILSGFLMAFTMSLDDFIITHFTKGPGIDTLSTKIYTEVKKGIKPEMYALSTIIFVVVLLLLLLVNHTPREKSAK